MPGPPLSVVETPLFQRQAAKLWDDATRHAFIDHIARHPDTGDLIPDTGGVRKIRWGRPGHGKRGGARVIYFYHDPRMPLFLLLAYAKAERPDMTGDEKAQVRALALALRRHYGRGG